jgi:putative MATE family efflux protein
LLQLRSPRLTEFFADREYFRQLTRFALPIAFQNLITGSLSLVGVIMVGQLGDVPVAAVGLANQMFFLLQLVLFGINSGAAIFTAQLWGKGDIPNIRKVLSLALLLGQAAALTFLALAELAPQIILGIYSKDPAVIAAGSEYLRIFGWAYVFFAITISFGIVLRSIGDVRTPTSVSISALAFNMLLSYVLIFGKLGLPPLGVRGAALAALVSRLLECAALLLIVYLRKDPIAIRPRQLLDLDVHFVGRVFKPILPVILNETFWSLGITAYYAIFARISTEAIAAMNIVGTIDNMALVLMFGVANATAIMVGNRIGAGQEKTAYRYGGRSLVLVMLMGVLSGGLVLLLSPYILSLYKVSPEVIYYAQRTLNVVALLLWMRAANATIVVGILRSGGDTLFSFFLDGVIIWVVGVPMGLLAAFVLDLPVYWVYLAVMSEEALKFILGVRRFLSRRWIHNLTGQVL